MEIWLNPDTYAKKPFMVIYPTDEITYYSYEEFELMLGNMENAYESYREFAKAQGQEL